MKTKLSNGNMKIGKLPNVSLPPITACNPEAPCFKDCYALKAFRQYPDTRNAWKHNLNLALNHRKEYFASIHSQLLSKRKLNFFRWHVSGDILDQNYLEEMKLLAIVFPKVKFLAFTKMHHLDFSRTPKNLTIVFSMWNSWGNKTKKIPRAYMHDGKTAKPKNAFHCPGLCENCMACWSLPELGKDVYFDKH